MKFIMIFAAIIALVYGEYKISEQFYQKAEEEMAKISEQCITEIKKMKEEELSTTKAGKCMISCFFQALEAQDKDGKFTKESILKSLEPYKSEDMALYSDMSILLVDKCLPEVKSADPCDAAFEISACYRMNATPEMVKAGTYW